MWLNKKPSSTHYCRPVNLQYKKETAEVSQGEYECLKEEIDVLNDFVIKNGDTECTENVIHKIKYKVDLTMLNGKVVNALTNTKSTQSCDVCGANPHK